MKISVIIPTLNCTSTIDECLKSIYSNEGCPPFEVIVVDGGSTDNTMQIAQKYPVSIYYSDKPQAKQRNLGIAKADRDIIAFTDADCRVKSDWLQVISRNFQDPSIASVGGPNITPPEDPFLARCIGALLESPVGSAGTRNTAVHASSREVSHNPPVNSAVRREVLEAVGGFAEDFAVSEDIMLDVKIRQKGYKLVYDPKMVVWHHRRTTLKGFLKQMVGYGRGNASVFLAYPGILPVSYFCAMLFTLGTVLTVPFLLLLPLLQLVIIAGWALYFVFLIFISIHLAVKNRNLGFAIVLPPLISMEHFSLGLGFIYGLINPYRIRKA